MDLKLEHRLHCAICASEALRGIKKIESFPVLPICSDEPFEKDCFAPLDVGICEVCGCLQLRTLVDQEFIYSLPHSEGIGATWAAHYAEFTDFILRELPIRGRLKVIEVGAGQGQISSLLKDRCELTVIEPNYGGPQDQIEVLNGFFSAQFLEGRPSFYDIVYSSHTLEHFYDIRSYFEVAALVLKAEGVLITAVPNLEAALQAGYANAFQFEHTVMLTLPHLVRLHQEFGFEIKSISYFRDHGIYFSSVKTPYRRAIEVNTCSYMEHLLEKLLWGIEKRKSAIESQLKPNLPHYLFGASQLSQFLFAVGLNGQTFDGVLDNAPTKNEKRLYGTRLRCKLPAQVLSTLERGQIFINGGPYTEEIYSQLEGLRSKQVELICL